MGRLDVRILCLSERVRFDLQHLRQSYSYTTSFHCCLASPKMEFTRTARERSTLQIIIIIIIIIIIMIIIVVIIIMMIIMIWGAGIAQLVVLGLAATVSRVRYSSGDIFR